MICFFVNFHYRKSVCPDLPAYYFILCFTLQTTAPLPRWVSIITDMFFFCMSACGCMRTAQKENLNFHFPAQIQAQHKRRQMVNQHQRTIVKKVGQRKSSIKNPVCSQYHIIQYCTFTLHRQALILKKKKEQEAPETKK